MTLEELYQEIGGSYEQAINVLRIEKLMDKHIRKLPKNDVFPKLIDAGRTMEPTQLFECAHAAKGICGNLGLVGLAEASSEIAEEFRPGNERKLTDAEVAERIDLIADLYGKTLDGIRRYEEA